MAARALRSGQIRVMARHVFPNALYALVVVATLYIATAIRTEAGLIDATGPSLECTAHLRGGEVALRPVAGQ